jgi:hypothetical protein
MITLSLLKYLEENGFGGIDVDLFFQKLTLGKRGIYITDIGDAQLRGARRSQSYEIYSRGWDDVDGYRRLSDIIDFLTGSYGVCRLPAVPPVTEHGYENVTIMPLSTINSVGLDDNGRMVYSATGTINY